MGMLPESQTHLNPLAQDNLSVLDQNIFPTETQAKTKKSSDKEQKPIPKDLEIEKLASIILGIGSNQP